MESRSRRTTRATSTTGKNKLKTNFSGGYYHGKKRRIPGRNAGQHEQSGGGAVEVTISGKKEVTKVKISEDAVDPDDVEMLEDLIMAATNEALRKVEDEAAKAMGKLAGGLGSMGGGFPF